MELTVVKVDDNEINKHVLMEVLDEDWKRIIIGTTHEIIDIQDTKIKVLARINQEKYLDGTIIDYKIVETGEGVITFSKSD